MYIISQLVHSANSAHAFAVNLDQLSTPAYNQLLMCSRAKQWGVLYTDDEVRALPFEDKLTWLRSNPVTAARHFHYRLWYFFKN